MANFSKTFYFSVPSIINMDQEKIIRQTTKFVQSKLQGESSGHDWWHVYRVWKNSVYIGRLENADLFVIQLAALLHDVADWKFHHENKDTCPEVARKWLAKLYVDEDIISHVVEIVKDISFKGAGVKTPMKTVEGMVVQDADRLDAIGAIGIGRAFAYGGYKGHEMHNPTIRPVMHQSFEQYQNSDGPTINHFYEKLLLLKDLMNTESAKRIAEDRHKFMEQFLDEFFKEWRADI